MTIASPDRTPSESRYCVAASNGCRSCDLLASMTVKSTLQDEGLSPRKADILRENILPLVIEVTNVTFPPSAVSSDEFVGHGQASCADRREAVVSISTQIAKNPPTIEG